MRSALKLCLAAFAAVVVLFAGAQPARAGPIAQLSVSVNPTSGGLFEYDYTVSVDAASTVGASQLFLDVSPSAALSSQAPTGWDTFYSAGDPDISFLSSDPSFDVAPGMVGTFVLTSAIGPAAASFLVRGIDDSSGSTSEVPGIILTPSAVPEPSSLFLGSIALAGGLFCLFQRGKFHV
jgi:hypothetical protein